MANKKEQVKKDDVLTVEPGDTLGEPTTASKIDGLEKLRTYEAMPQIKLVDTNPTVESIAAKVFPILLENFLKFGGRCTPQGYSDVTPESIIIITNQAAIIAESHIAALAKWRERKENTPKIDPDKGQERFA